MKESELIEGWHFLGSEERVLHPGSGDCEHVFVRTEVHWTHNYDKWGNENYLGYDNNEYYFCPKCLCHKVVITHFTNGTEELKAQAQQQARDEAMRNERVKNKCVLVANGNTERGKA